MKKSTKKYTCVIKRINCGEYDIERKDTDLEHIVYFYINPIEFPGFCARRYHTVYCDKHFLDDSAGRMLIDRVFIPMASLKGGEGFVFV